MSARGDAWGTIDIRAHRLFVRRRAVTGRILDPILKDMVLSSGWELPPYPSPILSGDPERPPLPAEQANTVPTRVPNR